MSDTAIEHLEPDDCWELLTASDFGRLGVATDEGGADIFPMNYLAKDRALYVRSAPGSKMIDLTRHPLVAFEVDGTRDRLRWSVVVKGEAQRLSRDSEIEESGVLGLWSQNPTEKWNYVRLTPKSVTGRRFASRRSR